jgi:hypothetical protein
LDDGSVEFNTDGVEFSTVCVEFNTVGVKFDLFFQEDCQTVLRIELVDLFSYSSLSSSLTKSLIL